MLAYEGCHISTFISRFIYIYRFYKMINIKQHLFFIRTTYVNRISKILINNCALLKDRVLVNNINKMDGLKLIK